MSRIFINYLRYCGTGRTPNQFFKNTKTLTTFNRNNSKFPSKTFNRTSTTSVLTNQNQNEFIIDSPYESKIIPTQNLVEYIFDGMDEEIMERPSLTCGVTGRTYNYGMMRMLINRFAQAVLSHCRMKPRETIGLLLPNIPEYVIVCHGAMEAGLPVTFVNPLYKANEIQRQFENAEVKLIVTVPQLIDVALEVGEKLINYHGTICIGGEDDLGKNIFGLESLLTAGHEAELPGINPMELAILPYSSGTTGMPKGVMLSHHNLVSNLVQLDHPDLKLINDNPDESYVTYTVLPFFHIYGFNTNLNMSLKEKAHLITLPRFNPEDYVKGLTTYRPQLLFVVPSLITFLTENSMIKKDYLESVKLIQSGAAPLTEGLIQRFKQKFGNHIEVKQGYGMTESSPVTLLMPNQTPSSKHNTIGVLTPNTTARIVDLTTNDLVGPNKSGELQIKGPQVMMGYLNNEKETNETIDEDGWLHTGDVAYYDDDKYFYIIDRCKELIKVKGNQVSPTELETLLLEIPEIIDAAVVGIPDALADEVPKAFVVIKPDAKITDKDILKYINGKVVHYKKLSGGVVFLDVIPRNPSGKILRNELKINECKYKSQ